MSPRRNNQQHNQDIHMSYQSKKATCPLCKGNKTVDTQREVFIIGDDDKLSEDVLAIADAMAGDNACPHCNGVGEVSVPPYSDGKGALLSTDKMAELAKAGTVLRCIGSAVFVQAVANQAARIVLPEDIVDTYVGYWADPTRAITLREYIFQIAQTAEELAMKMYGNLGNPIYAGPRKPAQQPSEKVETPPAPPRPYFLTDDQYDLIVRTMKKVFGLDGLEFKKSIMDIAKIAHANGVEQTTKAIQASMAAHYPELGQPSLVLSLIDNVGYYAKVQVLLYAQAAIDAYIEDMGYPPRETSMPNDKGQFLALFEALISQNPTAYERPGQTVYQVTKDELELLYEVLTKEI
jgi:hypothetical protein